MPLPHLHWSADVLPSHRWISYLPAIFLVCSPHPPSVKSLSTLSLCPCTSSRSRPPPFSGGSADLPASCSCTSYAVASGFWEQISLTDPPPSPPPLSLSFLTTRWTGWPPSWRRRRIGAVSCFSARSSCVVRWESATKRLTSWRAASVSWSRPCWPALSLWRRLGGRGRRRVQNRGSSRGKSSQNNSCGAWQSECVWEKREHADEVTARRGMGGGLGRSESENNVWVGLLQPPTLRYD